MANNQERINQRPQPKPPVDREPIGQRSNENAVDRHDDAVDHERDQGNQEIAAGQNSIFGLCGDHGGEESMNSAARLQAKQEKSVFEIRLKDERTAGVSVAAARRRLVPYLGSYHERSSPSGTRLETVSLLSSSKTPHFQAAELQNRMKTRPPDLPDFNAPPVTEVVLGVQFNALERLTAAHMGKIWDDFREHYPLAEQHHPIEPAYELFSEGGAPATAARFPLTLLTAFPVPRVFFVDKTRNSLIQFQKDRFLHNWRKIGDGDAYPRFEKMLNEFESGYRRMAKASKREGLGEIEPNQCEITYINQIRVSGSDVSAFERVFGSVWGSLKIRDLGAPEDVHFVLRYVIRDKKSQPLGRLTATADPARTPSGDHIVQFILVARGKPSSADLNGVSDFLRLGRRRIVEAFAELTTSEMHLTWGRKKQR
jgi:uncharacterized protein (TIGR04255 family)